MSFTKAMWDELNLILKFPQSSMMQGIKIHHDADSDVIKAAERLFDKGIITQPDGGYLTDLGHDLVEHASRLESALASQSASVT
ncbi:TIGR02647 family protein [Aestuariibacter salexigens]|uniref:TIGR02647 family protein n=1 Tax=Aestuariibacter salexigens TaxID=226010 RepID=UPI0003F9F88E|nr:TIGR02647 family protein [Aestuariibacter salexigens]